MYPHGWRCVLGVTVVFGVFFFRGPQSLETSLRRLDAEAALGKLFQGLKPQEAEVVSIFESVLQQYYSAVLCWSGDLLYLVLIHSIIGKRRNTRRKENMPSVR